MAGPGKGIAFAINQALDFKGNLDVAAAIEALPCTALIRFELGELRFPETKDVGLKSADAGYIANLEVKAIGDGWRFHCALLGKL